MNNDNVDDILGKRKMPDDIRQWSNNLPSTSSSTIYKLTGFFGDPRRSPSSYLKNCKKSDLQSILKRNGFTDEEIIGTKAQLLDKLINQPPSVTFIIDPRECLQRVLVTCLDAFKYDDSHLFEVTMPKRGDLLLGTKRLLNHRDFGYNIECYKAEYNQFYRQTGGSIEDFMEVVKRQHHYRYNIKDQEKYIEILEGLLEGTIDINSYHYSRVVNGAAFQAHNTFHGTPLLTAEIEVNDRNIHLINQQRDMQLYGGGALSLDSVCLRVGDWLEYMYDMGDQHFINVRVEEINEINNVLPEIGNNPTRVQIIQTANLHHVISQYDNEDEYDSDDYYENDNDDENNNDNDHNNDNDNNNGNDNENE